MKKGIFLILMCLILIGTGSLIAQTEKELFDGARLALFDRQWDQAFGQLSRLTQLYPNTSYYAQAQFYMGKCRQEKNDPVKALAYYEAFLKVSGNESLKEEAQVAMIDLYFQLYTSGQKSYLEKILHLLNASPRAVQYYAAFKLSYAADKTVATRAVPVLKQMVQNEGDQALVDRAKIALMRIGPQYVKQLSRSQNLEEAFLFIRITNKKSGRVTFSLNIPFALARLALDAMSDQDKKKLNQNGNTIEAILQKITQTQKLVKIDAGDEIIEIGIQ